MIENTMTEVIVMKCSRWLILVLLLGLMCLCTPALAEDVYTVDNAAEAVRCITDRSYLRVRCPLAGEQPVTMSIHDEWGYLVYQRDYGLCRDSFRSEDVYLRLDGSAATYTVTLQAGSDTYMFLVTREMAKLTDSGVYACGLPLSDLSGTRSNKFAVIIDVDALEGSTLTVPLISGGAQLGYVYYTVDGGALSVSAMLTVDGEIIKSAIYVARDAVTAQTLGTNHFTGRKARLDRDIDLSGTPYAAVMVQLTVSYDPATAQAWYQDDFFIGQQRSLWELMKLTTANEAVG